MPVYEAMLERFDMVFIFVFVLGLIICVTLLILVVIVVRLFFSGLFNIFYLQNSFSVFLNLVNNVQLRDVIFLYFCAFERMFGPCFELGFDFLCSRWRGHLSRIL
jgi:hypothetical protein